MYTVEVSSSLPTEKRSVRLSPSWRDIFKPSTTLSFASRLIGYTILGDYPNLRQATDFAVHSTSVLSRFFALSGASSIGPRLVFIILTLLGAYMLHSINY